MSKKIQTIQATSKTAKLMSLIACVSIIGSAWLWAEGDDRAVTLLVVGLLAGGLSKVIRWCDNA